MPPIDIATIVQRNSQSVNFGRAKVKFGSVTLRVTPATTSMPTIRIAVKRSCQTIASHGNCTTGMAIGMPHRPQRERPASITALQFEQFISTITQGFIVALAHSPHSLGDSFFVITFTQEQQDDRWPKRPDEPNNTRHQCNSGPHAVKCETT